MTNIGIWQSWCPDVYGSLSVFLHFEAKMVMNIALTMVKFGSFKGSDAYSLYFGIIYVIMDYS